jgi:hypothetical protein
MTRVALVLVAALSLLAGRPDGGTAQATEAAVLRPIQELFDAMADGDADRAAAVILADGQWVSVRPGPDGGRVVVVMPHREFLTSLAAAAEPWLERMWDPQVMVHGDIALVWTPYDFHRGGRFSHCGMEAFTLVRTGDGWRIAGATYTVEPTGCDPSPLGPPAGS